MTEATREQAADDVRWAVRKLTANLMRVMRGAGKGYEIGMQAQSLVDALNEYRKAHGFWPSHDLFGEMLSIRQDSEASRGASPGNRHFSEAAEDVVEGALQVAASKLIGQSTQESAGRKQMHQGIRDVQAAIAEMNAELQDPKATKKARRRSSQVE